MIQKLERISFCLLVFIVLTAGSFGAASSAATVGQDNGKGSTTRSTKRLHDTSPGLEVASTKGRKHGQRTIIFVGGKKGSQGAATRSNPTSARRSNGSLNPQPIPPGKQRQPK